MGIENRMYNRLLYRWIVSTRCIPGITGCFHDKQVQHSRCKSMEILSALSTAVSSWLFKVAIMWHLRDIVRTPQSQIPLTRFLQRTHH